MLLVKVARVWIIVTIATSYRRTFLNEFRFHLEYFCFEGGNGIVGLLKL